MTIARVRVQLVSAPLERPFWMSLEPYTASSELLVIIETIDGAEGYGQVHGRPMELIADLLIDGLAPLLLGRDPLDHAELWGEMFALSHSRSSAEFAMAEGQPHFGGGVAPQLMAAIAGVDIALWDLKGKLAGQPLHRLLGSRRRELPVYASGGYYAQGRDEIEAITEEVSAAAEQGFRAVKMKVAGLPVPEDTKRIAAVRDAYPDMDIMLDANSGYSVPDAITAARAFEPHGISWFEEPVHWYDPVDGLAQVSAATTIPTASGESALHRWQCRDLVDRAGIRFMQFDCTRAGGVTEWLKVAAYAAHHGIVMAPHHDPQIHGHLLAAVDNGHILEFFPNRARDPLWFELYETKPEIAGGKCRLPDGPGLGITFDWKAVENRRTGEVREVRR
jgi:L-alanine-DL-glutamate epimerase-like enolase superfamily enzyme